MSILLNIALFWGFVPLMLEFGEEEACSDQENPTETAVKMFIVVAIHRGSQQQEGLTLQRKSE